MAILAGLDQIAMIKKPTGSLSYLNYSKTLARLQQGLITGRFAGFTQRKKQQLWKRLCRYARQLGIQVKASFAAALVAAGLCISTPAKAQSFSQQFGSANPLNSASVTQAARPAFADIDDDGDMDCFIGEAYGSILFYRNTGTASSPVFAQETGGSNPLNLVSVFYYSSPAFQDIDDDGDQDAFVANFYGDISFYRNDGSAAAPSFTAVGGGGNPLNGFNTNQESVITSVDIDNDGDFDVFANNSYGNIIFLRNDGTPSSPAFTEVSGGANPFNGVDPVGGRQAPAFADLDGDGDLDCILGQENGTFLYYRNTGTAAAPVFTQQTGGDNPLNGVVIDGHSRPALVSIDGDGDADLFAGVSTGSISYFENTSAVVPLLLIEFNGKQETTHVSLQWKTASEENTHSFEVERSEDGVSFTRLATVPARGSGDHAYAYRDHSADAPRLYYRLKMLDIDERYEYSPTILIKGEPVTRTALYPNPAPDFIGIDIGNSELLNTWAIFYDGNGRTVQNVLLKNARQQVYVGALKPGIYLIRFADGLSRQFIKK